MEGYNNNIPYFTQYQSTCVILSYETTSNTAMIGEVIIHKFLGKNPVRGGMTALANFTASSNLSVCLGAVRDSGDPKLFANEFKVQSDEWYQLPGRGWGVGWCLTSCFATAMPPNSPNCGVSQYPMSAATSLTVSSYHSGGCNIAMADGAVRFISETIDTGDVNTNVSANYTTDPAANAVGASPWGVWGAMGSAQGGETKAL